MNTFNALLEYMVRKDGTIYSQECCSCGRRLIDTPTDSKPMQTDIEVISAHAKSCNYLKRDLTTART